MTIEDVQLSPCQWREIPGTHGHYEASADGCVRRALGGGGTSPGRIIRGGINNTGYRIFRPCVNGKHLGILSFHRAVWSAFNGPIPEGLDICHWNHKRDDNRLANLYAGTRSENLRQSVNEGRPVGKGMTGRRNSAAKLSWRDAQEIRRLYATGAFDQRLIGSLYGITQSTVSKIHLAKSYKKP
jgi:hypothetical protein